MNILMKFLDEYRYLFIWVSLLFIFYRSIKFREVVVFNIFKILKLFNDNCFYFVVFFYIIDCY